MNKDQVKGRVEQAAGKTKKGFGKVFGNKEMEQEGMLQDANGKIQAGYGDVKEEIKKSTDGE